MRLTILFVVASGVPILAQAQPASTALCDAASTLEREAAHSNTPQRITLFASEPMEIACRREAAVPAQVAFCSADMEAVVVVIIDAIDCTGTFGVHRPPMVDGPGSSPPHVNSD